MRHWGKKVFHIKLFLWFIFGVIAYVFRQRIVRGKMIRLTNEVECKKRVHMLNKILRSSYEDVEKIEKGRIQATMINDTESISNFANVIVWCITNLITL